MTSRLYQVGCAIILVGVTLVVIMLGAAAISVAQSPESRSMLPFLSFTALIAFIIVLIIVAALYDSWRLQQRVDRIRSLGHRVVAHFVRVATSQSTMGDGTSIQTITHYHLEAAWLNPDSGQLVTLHSQVIPQAIAQSFQIDDPVVVFVDPEHPTACVFDLNTQV